MKRLWVQLSLAFSAVIILATVLSFALLFIGDWVLPEPPLTVERVLDLYADAVAPWLETAIVAGQDDEAIVAELQRASETRLRTMLVRLRAEGWAPSVDRNDRSLRRILGDFLRELFAPDLLRTAIVSGVIGIVAGMWMSRRLTAPLTRLATAVQAFGKGEWDDDGVTVDGSQEIAELARAFNQMAADLRRAEDLRRHLLADVSHELRTPLAGLEGSLRASLDHVYELDEERVARLYNQTRRLTRLIEDLRLLAQAEARQLPLVRRPVALSPIIDETLALVGFQAADKDIEVTGDRPGSLPLVYADADRLHQVLHNLLANAVRHTPPGGRIHVTAQPHGKGVQIEVADSGEGIAPEHLPYLFERFYRTDRARSRDTGGSGLGLAIARAIVEAHGGRIRAESPGRDQGATFTIWLPSSVP